MKFVGMLCSALKRPCLLLMLISGLYGTVAQSQTARVRNAAQNGNPSEVWQTFRSPEGRFAIDMPGVPERKSRPIETHFGQVELHGYGMDVHSISYAVMFNDFPAEAGDPPFIEEGYDGGRDSLLASTKSWLVSERKMRMGKLAGREIMMENGLKRMTIRMYFDGARLYQAMVLAPAFPNTPEATLKHYDQLANKFLSSFKVDGSADKRGTSERKRRR